MSEQGYLVDDSEPAADKKRSQPILDWTNEMEDPSARPCKRKYVRHPKVRSCQPLHLLLHPLLLLLLLVAASSWSSEADSGPL